MMTMIDDPEKTMAFLSALKAAVPFDADITHELAEILAVRHGSVSGILCHAVTDVVYAGDEGGIMCRIAATNGELSRTSLSFTKSESRKSLASFNILFKSLI